MQLPTMSPVSNISLRSFRNYSEPQHLFFGTLFASVWVRNGCCRPCQTRRWIAVHDAGKESLIKKNANAIKTGLNTSTRGEIWKAKKL
jgi:hypothetical protein